MEGDQVRGYSSYWFNHGVPVIGYDRFGLGPHREFRIMKDEPQLFTRIDVQGTPVEAEVLNTLEDIGMSEVLLRRYVQEALVRLYIRNKLLISEHA